MILFFSSLEMSSLQLLKTAELLFCVLFHLGLLCCAALPSATGYLQISLDVLLGGLSSPLAFRGAVSRALWVWVGQQKLVQTKWAVVPLLSWNRSPGVTWLGHTGQSLAPSQCCNSFSLPGEHEAESSAYKGESSLAWRFAGKDS